LYGCETWSLTLRGEHRLRVFENRVLRRIFGPKRYGVTGEWRRLHNEELNDLYSSSNANHHVMQLEDERCSADKGQNQLLFLMGKLLSHIPLSLNMVF
jgi:hypothetical protein